MQFSLIAALLTCYSLSPLTLAAPGVYKDFRYNLSPWLQAPALYTSTDPPVLNGKKGEAQPPSTIDQALLYGVQGPEIAILYEIETYIPQPPHEVCELGSGLFLRVYTLANGQWTSKQQSVDQVRVDNFAGKWTLFHSDEPIAGIITYAALGIIPAAQISAYTSAVQATPLPLSTRRGTMLSKSGMEKWNWDVRTLLEGVLVPMPGKKGRK